MQNSKKISTRKLALSKETLRHLDGMELRQAAGGRIPRTQAHECGSALCDAGNRG